MKIGCETSVTFPKNSVKEVLGVIKKVGFEYVEVGIDVDKDDPKEFKEMFKSSGLKSAIELWSSHFEIISDDETLESGKKCIPWASEAGISMVLMADGFKPADMSEEDAFNILKKRILEILEVAEKYKVYVAILTYGTFSMTVEGIKKIMSISNSKYFGMNYDTANIYRANNIKTVGSHWTSKIAGVRQSEVEVLKEVAKYVLHVDVKDVIGDDCVALGKGEVNLEGCIKVLKESGYDGVLTFEAEGDRDLKGGEEIIKISYDYINKVLKELK